MVAQSVEQVFGEITAYIDKEGWAHSHWYCGIASNPEDRLFNEHTVIRGNRWIYRQCYNDFDARAVEKELLKLGCDGGRGGGDESTVFVYAYLKGLETNP